MIYSEFEFRFDFRIYVLIGRFIVIRLYDVIMHLNFGVGTVFKIL